MCDTVTADEMRDYFLRRVNVESDEVQELLCNYSEDRWFNEIVLNAMILCDGRSYMDNIYVNFLNIPERCIQPPRIKQLFYPGSNKKWFLNNKIYKVDQYGDGVREEIVTKLLECSTLAPNEYVHYYIFRDGELKGCVSNNFLKEGECFIDFISIAELPPNLCQNDLYLDEFWYEISNRILQIYGIDVEQYLANVFTLDMLIRNTDRNLGNLGIILNTNNLTARIAPIFDNGVSLGAKMDYDFEYMSKDKDEMVGKFLSSVPRLKYRNGYRPYDEHLDGIGVRVGFSLYQQKLNKLFNNWEYPLVYKEMLEISLSKIVKDYPEFIISAKEEPDYNTTDKVVFDFKAVSF